MAQFSPQLMDHFKNPRNVGRLNPCDVEGVAGTPGQGNFMILTLRIDQAIISDIAFQTFGCGPAIASGSVVTDTLKGKPLSQAQALTRDDISQALGGIPPHKLYCADLAIEALQDALRKVRMDAPAE